MKRIIHTSSLAFMNSDLLKGFLPVLFLMLSASGWGQTTLVTYPFTGNSLTGGSYANPALQTSPTISYHKSDGTAETPNWYGERLRVKTYSDYIEITLDTRGFTNVGLSFDAFYKYWGVYGEGEWQVSYNAGAGFVNYGSVTVDDTNIFHSGEKSGSYNQTLPSAADNNPNLVIRIRSFQDFAWFGFNSYLDIDNINITAGNAIIGVYNAANDNIPHESLASYVYDTDFGTVLTSAGSVSKTYTIKNTGSIPLSISSIVSTGLHASDFLISSIPSSVPVNGSRNFTVTFDPTEDGIRTADVLIYSNSSPDIYKFNVQGRGVSCSLSPSTFKQNSFGTGTPSLTTIGNPTTVSGGSGTSNRPYHVNMYVPNGSDTRSWGINNTSQMLEFGPVDITNEKNVSISFYIAAFTSGNATAGVNKDAYITLSVFNPSTNSWSNEMHLKGSGGDNTRFYYPFSTNSGVFIWDFDGDNTVEERTNTGNTNDLSGKTSSFKLNIPATYGNQLRFRITAKTQASNVFWLIDEVAVNSENTVFKTFTTGNVWSPSPPTANEKAVIEGNLILPPGDYNVCECEVKSGGALTLQPEANLTLQGKLVNNGNVTVESDANLIQIEEEAVNEGEIIVQRFVEDIRNSFEPGKRMDYIYWSSPVAGQQLKGFSPGTPNNRFYYYNEGNDFFYPSDHLSNFVPGKGYAIRAEDGLDYEYERTYEFEGTPINGAQASSLEVVKSVDGNGYNLIGNPYPSNIDADDLFAANPAIYSTVFLWENNVYIHNQQGAGYYGSNYAIYNGTGGVSPTTYPGTGVTPNGIIKVGQGFIVQKRDVGTSNIVFKNSMRKPDSGHFYYKNAKDRFWVSLISPMDTENSMLIGYILGATDAYEKDYDAVLLSEGSDAIYSILDEEKLAIQGLEYPVEDSDVIPLGVKIFSKGKYKIELKEREGIFQEKNVFLKDKYVNTIHNLTTEGTYQFESTGGTFTDRFEIVFKDNTPSNGPVLTTASKSHLIIQKQDHQIVITSSKDKILEVELFNLSGWSIYKKSNVNARELRIPAGQFGKQIIVVRVQTETGEIQTKKLINK